MEEAATQLKINLNSKTWPKAANALSGRLNEVKTNLREIGIIIDTEAAKDPKTRVKIIHIQKTPELCKPSFGSLDRSQDKNHAQVASDDSNDHNESERYDRSQGNEQNRAQNWGSNDANDTNDTLPSLHGQYFDPSSDNLEEWWQNECKKITPLNTSYFASSGLRCYYCEDFEIDILGKEGRRKYEAHVKSKHGDDLDHPCYPTMTYIERLGLKAQGKDWEK